MANWLHTLDISDLHTARANNRITVKELSSTVSNRLEELLRKNTPPIEHSIIAQGHLVVVRLRLAHTTVQYDAALRRLYDWGDQAVKPIGPKPSFSMTPKLCWINTN